MVNKKNRPYYIQAIILLIFLLTSSYLYIEYISVMEKDRFTLNFSILIILTLLLSIWPYISSRRKDQLLSEISGRREVEKKLKESEEKYRNIVETSRHWVTQKMRYSELSQETVLNQNKKILINKCLPISKIMRSCLESLISEKKTAL
jgi:hypothetical protein